MKKILFSVVLVFVTIYSQGQNLFPETGSVGIGTATPDVSAALDVTSRTQGVLITRLTITERNAITTPATGLLIYQTNSLPGFYYYNGVEWVALKGLNANSSLSNLTSTSINVNLLPDTTDGRNVGSTTRAFKRIFLTRGVTFIGTNAYVGYLSGGDSAAPGKFNAALGYLSLRANVKGNYNTAVGNQALKSVTTAFSNTAVGSKAGINNIGNYNTIAGANSGINKTGKGTFIGYNANSNSAVVAYSNVTALGADARVTASNQVRIGNAAVTSIGGYVDWSNISDGRFKRNLKNNVPGLEFIRSLKPVTYNLDIAAIDRVISPSSEEESSETRMAQDAKSKLIYTGFVAQEVEATAKKLNYDFSGVDAPKNDNDLYGLRYSQFVAPLVKSVQELDKQNQELKEELAQLKEMVLSLTKINSGSISSEVSGSLNQNSPNPFNGNTVIGFSVPKGSRTASLVITETTTGKVVKTIAVSINATQVNLNTGTLASGTYSYTLLADGKKVDTKQMILNGSR